MQYMMEHGKTSVSPTPRKKSMDMIEEKMNQIFFKIKVQDLQEYQEDKHQEKQKLRIISIRILKIQL